MMILDEDEAAGIRQAFDIHDRIDTIEGRQNHRVLELELALFPVVAIFIPYVQACRVNNITFI